MDFEMNPNDKPKYIAISVLTGIGKGIGAFLLTGIIYFIVFLLSLLISFESLPLMILALTPLVALVGGFVAILVGIRGGQNKYQDLLKSGRDLPIQEDQHEIEQPVDPAEMERRRVEKLGVEVTVCPSCQTLNSLSLSTCEKCSANLIKAKPIRNPYV